MNVVTGERFLGGFIGEYVKEKMDLVCFEGKHNPRLHMLLFQNPYSLSGSSPIAEISSTIPSITPSYPPSLVSL